MGVPVTERLAWMIVGLVALVWLATTVVLPVADPSYQAPPSVGATMGSLAGGAAAYLFARRSGNGNGNGKKNTKGKK